MNPDPSTFIRVIRFEQEQQFRALMTARILRGGWDAPTAAPNRLRSVLATVVGWYRHRPSPAPIANEASGSPCATPLVRRGVG